MFNCWLAGRLKVFGILIDWLKLIDKRFYCRWVGRLKGFGILIERLMINKLNYLINDELIDLWLRFDPKHYSIIQKWTRRTRRRVTWPRFSQSTSQTGPQRRVSVPWPSQSTSQTGPEKGKCTRVSPEAPHRLDHREG